MTKRLAVLAVALATALPSVAGAQQVLTVNADMGQDTINRHIYGHFAEHLGRDIYDGFWIQDDDGEWGYNDQVIEALRQIEIPNLRWPGGCFADYYHWQDGIGPQSERPKMVNTIWGGVTEDNSFGTHEFMELVRRLDTEPFVVGNVGSGTVKEMADWWEYLNHPGGSSLADERAANGHPEPYDVRFWGVGNESWGCGGEMTPEYYSDVYKRFAEFIRSIGDVSPFKVATGPNSGDYEWTKSVMENAGDEIDGLDFHYYTRVRSLTPPGSGVPWWQQEGPQLSRSATDFGEAEWFVGVRNAHYMDELITRHSAIMDQYDPDKEVWLIVGEWGMWHAVEPGTNPGFLYQQNSLRDAVVAGLHLNIFNNHADRVRMANIAQTVNVLQAMVLTRDDEMILTPTYHVFEMYTPHHDALLLPIQLDAGTYEYDEYSTPAVSASASTKDGQIFITLTNVDPNEARTVRTEIRGGDVSSVSGRVLTADAINAHNTFESPDVVRPVPFDGATLSGSTLTVELPAKSVVALTLR